MIKAHLVDLFDGLKSTLANQSGMCDEQIDAIINPVQEQALYLFKQSKEAGKK